MKHSFSGSIDLRKYDFDSDGIELLKTNRYVKDNWPITYIITHALKKEAYIGESANALKRMQSHLKSEEKKHLKLVHIVASPNFNKSSALDVESSLIKYMSADEQYKLINSNAGLVDHSYFQREEYNALFRELWKMLREEGITKHSLSHISNSDLFKYSPYKSLSLDQHEAVLNMLRIINDPNKDTVMAIGSAGTGKTILAVYLIKLLMTRNVREFDSKDEFSESELEILISLRDQIDDLKIGMVVPMTSLRQTIKNVFKNVKGLSAKMVLGPNDVAKEKYDLLIVDEAHRLKRRKSITNYGSFDDVCEKLGLDKHTATEFDWIRQQSKMQILFYDANQSIRPADIERGYFAELERLNSTSVVQLTSQMRVKSSTDYVEYIRKLIHGKLKSDEEAFEDSEYELLLFDDIESFVESLKKRDQEAGLSRMIAGFGWQWKSKSTLPVPAKFDIEIDGHQLIWNRTNADWINSPNAVNEVGCIHTTQGYDLNYAAVIFGPEIAFDPLSQRVIIRKENYHDSKGKQAVHDLEVLRDYILNVYQTIMLRGIRGTYVYVCDVELRKYFSRFIPRARLMVSKTVDTEIIPFKNAVPLYAMEVAASEFGLEQNVKNAQWIPVKPSIRVTANHFACRVIGESMNKKIPNGSTCLFRKYLDGSREGQIVLVELSEGHFDDTGSRYTVKKYRSEKRKDENGWIHTSISLSPMSYSPDYSDIILRDDEFESLRVIGIFEKVLSN